MTSFAGISDYKDRERLKGVFASARGVAGMKVGGTSPISSRDLENLEYAQKGLAGFKFASEPQNPAARAFSSSPHHHTGVASSAVKFGVAQARDTMLSMALNAVAPGVGTLYGALSLVRQGQNAVAGSGIMPAGPQPKGSVVGGMMGSFADHVDQVRGVGVPSRLAAKGPVMPKPGYADIMGKMRPDESAGQIRLEKTAAHFNQVIDQKIDGLNALTTGGHVDVLANGMMSSRAAQQMDSIRINKIAENKGYGDLSDTGIDTERIKKLATRTHAPTPIQQAALAPVFG